MKKKYYEVVFEGYWNAIEGLLQGFILGKGKEKEWNYYFSKKTGIKTETLTEAIMEWITLQTKLHHIIMPAELYDAFSSALVKTTNPEFADNKYIKSSREIKNASFEFIAKTYGSKYGTEIKAMINNLPKGLEIHNYNPMEKTHEESKGVEMYAPEHHYIFEAEGRISGEIELIEVGEAVPFLEVTSGDTFRVSVFTMHVK